MKNAVYFSLVVVFFATFAAGKVNPDNVTFIFYSREHFNGVSIHYDGDPQFVQVKKVFNPRLSTVVLIHGWQDNYEANSNTFVRSAILSKLNVNIIKVDWSPLSTQGYFTARDSVPFVGQLAANLLRKITKQFSYSLDDVTLVGFSLGAHVSGNIGKTLLGQVGVIMALDPAGPFISSSDIGFCIHPTDAKYVQAIHTNGGTLGMTDAVGHSDFYPNGGSRQPGCGLDLVGGCAHNRAWEYFAESVTRKGFVGQNCDTWNKFRNGRCSGENRLMGGLLTIDKKARGKYYLKTKSASPFGKN